MGLRWLVSLTGSYILIGMWFDKDQRINFVETRVLRKLKLHLEILRTGLHSIVYTIGRR
jgi:hypothetical protein